MRAQSGGPTVALPEEDPEPLQNKALWSVSRMTRFVRTVMIHNTLGAPTLDIFAKDATAKFFFRVSEESTCPQIAKLYRRDAPTEARRPTPVASCLRTTTKTI